MSNFWKIFISIVITIAVAGGGIYYLMQKQIDSIRSDNQDQMDTLNKQIASLKSTASTTAAPATTTTPTTTDETANWKTYTSSYGYSFKYPTNWILNSSDPNVVAINSPENEALKGQNYEGYMMDIAFNYYDNLSAADGNNPKKYQSFSDWINDTGYFSGMTKTTLGDVVAYDGAEGGFGAYYINVAEHGSHYFKVLFGNAESKSKLTSTDSKILDTFQFTK